MASVAQTALAAGLFRFDASDQMPSEIGVPPKTTTASRGRSLLQGMLDWVDGVRTIDQVFADIDAEWAALESAGRESAARFVTSSTLRPAWLTAVSVSIAINPRPRGCGC